MTARRKAGPPLPKHAVEAWLQLLTCPELQPAAAGPPPEALPWALEKATLVLPVTGRVSFRELIYPYQQALLADRSERRIILKARQTGVSNVCAIEALWAALTQENVTELFVSKNQDAAQELIRYCGHTYSGLTGPLPKLVTENQGEMAWENGSRIVSLPSTPATGRGIAAQRVYLDEFAFCAYDQLVYDAIVPTLSHGGQLTVLSTPNGRANLFYRLWEDLEGGDWSKHEIRWDQCPRYTEAWAARTRTGMSAQAFAQEYDCDFIASGDAVFKPEDLRQCRQGYDPIPTGGRMITAWDIGRRQDHTVGITLEEKGEAWHVVAYERFMAAFPQIQAHIEVRHDRFPAAEEWVESNGIGDPVIENLRPDVKISINRFTTTQNSKIQAIQALQLLIEQGRFKHAEPQMDRELGLYQHDDKRLVQDTVMASAIAAKAAIKPEMPVQVFF